MEVFPMIFKVQQMQGVTWKDLVEIPDDYRKDVNGNHIERGTICKVEANDRSKYVIVVGLKENSAVIGLDLNLRKALNAHLDKDYEFMLREASCLGRLAFTCSLSDPAYRIPAQISIIALILGTILGLIGVFLGGIPLYEEKYGPIFTHQSTVSSGVQDPGKPKSAK
jgi:hypothetical protein